MVTHNMTQGIYKDYLSYTCLDPGTFQMQDIVLLILV